jgi:DNA helicase HerA-like ATPase
MAQNQPNREELMQMAVNAIRNGQKKPARVMLQRILGEDKENTRAMMYMAKIARNSDERRKWLNHVLDVDMHHEAAIKALDKMDYTDAVKRNRNLLKIGIGAYVAVVLVVAAVILLATAAQPPI